MLSATAILDRFLFHSEIIQITGWSYRMENQQRGPKETKASTRSGADKSPRGMGQMRPVCIRLTRWGPAGTVWSAPHCSGSRRVL